MLTDFDGFHTGNLACPGLMDQLCIKSVGFSTAILAVVLAKNGVCTVVRWFLSGLQAWAAGFWLIG